MNHKLESRFPGEMSTDDTTLVAQSEEELKSLLMKVKGESVSWLKTQHSKNVDLGIQSHHFMANRRGKSGNSNGLYFFGSKITADDDCSHDIKRCLLLGKKTMTNLDNILKSRDMTLLEKFCLVKAMVFPVVMYGCESWIIMKPECQRTDAFETVLLERTLESPLDSKDIQPVHPKGDQLIGKDPNARKA